MANWSETTKHLPSEINQGKQYEKKDRLSRESLNALAENSFYAMKKSDDAKTESASALNKATEALNKATEGSGTTVNVNGTLQSEINFTSDPQNQINDLSERLTRLGFRQGVATFSSDALEYLENTSYINLYRQGNYVILKGKLYFKSGSQGNADYMSLFFTRNGPAMDFFTIPNDFLPLSNFKFFVGGAFQGIDSSSSFMSYGLAALCSYSSNGIVTADSITDYNMVAIGKYSEFEIEFSVGYEAQPIS